jgi:ATP-dependent DNA ligase
MFLSDKQRKAFFYRLNANKFSLSNAGLISGENRSGAAMLAKLADPDSVNDLIKSDRTVICDKYDGIRTFAVVNNDNAEMFNPRHEPDDFSWKFPEIRAELLDQLKDVQPSIVDGEIVYEVDGKDEVHRVTARLNMTDHNKILNDVREHPMEYRVFDIIEYGDTDVSKADLGTRLGILDQAIEDTSHVKKAVCAVTDKDKFMKGVFDAGREGVVFKDLSSDYEFGEKSGSWKKVKKSDSDSFVVYAIERGSGKNEDKTGSLLIGKYVDGKFEEVGRVGTGLTESDRAYLWDKYGSETASKIVIPDEKRFVVDVKFMEKDSLGGLRSPRVERIREDISPKENIVGDVANG